MWRKSLPTRSDVVSTGKGASSREVRLARGERGRVWLWWVPAVILAFCAAVIARRLPRSPRTAVYVVADPTRAPQALLHNIKHNAVLHERNVVLTVTFRDEPVVPAAQRLAVEPLGHDFWRVRVTYGFMEAPDVPVALEACRGHGLDINLFAVSYFLSRAIVIPRHGASRARWRESLFATMARDAGSVAEFFQLPPNCVVELWKTGRPLASKVPNYRCHEGVSREAAVDKRSLNGHGRTDGGRSPAQP